MQLDYFIISAPGAAASILQITVNDTGADVIDTERGDTRRVDCREALRLLNLAGRDGLTVDTYTS